METKSQGRGEAESRYLKNRANREGVMQRERVEGVWMEGHQRHFVPLLILFHLLVPHSVHRALAEVHHVLRQRPRLVREEIFHLSKRESEWESVKCECY